MRSTNRKRALLVSGSVILLCMTLIVGMTWALFTDTKNLKNHIQAGDLEITLKRTALTKTTLNEKGYLQTKDVQLLTDDPVDFTKATEKTVFDLEMDKDGKVTEKVVPGSKFTATMQIENHGDVAFGYWIRIDCKDEDVAKALAQQLKVTVYTDKNKDGTIDTGEKTKESDGSYVGKGLVIGGATKDDYIGVLEVNQKESFIVAVEFEDKGFSYVDGVLTSANDGAQLQNVEFDLIVHAVQITKAS